jgi:hypothetical protein
MCWIAAGSGACLQVHVIQLKFSQAGLDGGWDVFESVENLRSDKELFSWYTRLLDSNSNFLFSTIGISAIYVMEAILDGSLQDLDQIAAEGFIGVIFEPGRARSKTDLQKPASELGEDRGKHA